MKALEISFTIEEHTFIIMLNLIPGYSTVFDLLLTSNQYPYGKQTLGIPSFLLGFHATLLSIHKYVLPGSEL